MTSTIIVGGGIGGLATAALLAAEGHDVTVLEARETVGGRAGSWERDGFRFDTGPSWYLMPDVFEHFFELLGTSAAEQLDLEPLLPAYRVFDAAGAPLDVVSGRDEARALFESVEPGSGERIDAYLDSAADAYELSVTRFLYDPYSSYGVFRDRELLRRLPQLVPLLTRNLASHIESRFSEPRLQHLLQYPAVFLGGSPYDVPSLYHLMSHLDLGDGVLYPRGGIHAVIEAIARLAEERGAVVRTGSDVAEIVVEGGVARGVRLTSGEQLSADVVVSAADLHHTETELLRDPKTRSYPESWWTRRTPSPGALLILLGVRGELPELAHHTLLFADEWSENFEAIFGKDTKIPDDPSLYICRPSATDDTVAPAGSENLFVLVPVPADPGLGRGGVDGAGDASIEAAADRTIALIAERCGIPDLAERIVVRRTIAPGDFVDDLRAWRGNALGLAHTLRQSAVFRPRNVSRRVRNLYYAGASVLPGIGLPMCLISAELVLKRLRGDTSSGPIAAPVRAAV